MAFTPFSGCFGLLVNGMIPKPTYYAFAFYKELFPTAVAKTVNMIVTKSENGDLRGVAWSINAEITLNLSANVEPGVYFLLLKTVDEDVCNPLKVWLDSGSSASPSKRQIKLLRDCARPQFTTARIDAADGGASRELKLKQNALVFFELQKYSRRPTEALTSGG